MRHDILYGDMLNYVNDMNEACAVSEGTFSLERFDDSGANHLLDGVSRQGVEEHGEEEGEEDDEDDLEDCPLVVVPDDVPGHKRLYNLTLVSYS